ncbi:MULTISPECIES: ATP-grasp domain-containing protein [unclassified Streptomyces]|uniref:ATP-grasp domain-containing protein n=1 Tax=unclassified Streptomyces TaxID=2593676 RepID=UPI002DDB78BE|nr:ATP-grasp domain-containing protein [Streptomyces sp. NBC_01237]WRZ77512.1 ATP-grasp domain-containing protein [Streptomyces sp. NBC_01237]
MHVEILPARGGTGAMRERPGGHYYGGPAYAAGAVDDLAVALLEPTDNWLAALPYEYTGRRITTATLAEARLLSRPAFVKPPSDKCFPAAVYPEGRCLPSGPELKPDTPVQISDVVTWTAEFRLFLLEGTVHTGSQYATFGRLDSAPLEGHRCHDAVREFADGLLAGCGHTLPSAVVVDIGLLSMPEHGAADRWAVVEANMAWFSNCYAADPDRALDVVLRSAGPRSRLAARDRRFCRDRGHADPVRHHPCP